MYGPDLIRSDPNRSRPTKQRLTRRFLRRPATSRRRTGAGRSISAARRKPRQRLVESATVDRDFRKNSFRIPAIFGAFSGDSDHLYWQMWYETESSCQALHVYKF